MIIGYAVDGLSPLDGYKIRVRFSLVCRAWRDSIELASHRAAVGLANVGRLAISLQGSGSVKGDGVAVESLYVELTSTRGQNKAQRVVGLLGEVPNVSDLELVLNNAAFGSGQFDVLEKTRHLEQITSFALGAKAGSKNPITFGTGVVSRSVNCLSLNSNKPTSTNTFWPRSPQANLPVGQARVD